ncbi:MAG: fatty acid desaturase [Thermoanaerobaculia bacterium]
MRPRYRPSAVLGFLLVHAAALGVLFVGFSWMGVALCLGSYYLRMFAITTGFHRYFSHRTYRLARVPQFLLAFLCQTAAQKGVLWWASNHRHHHRYSDLPEDIHSPAQKGFWWAHVGWILVPDYEETDLSRVPDLAKYPELVWLDRNQFLATFLYAVGCYAAFGAVGLFYGYFLSTVLLWHGTFSINSLMHLVGRRVFPTTDTSRNSFALALLTTGEGWHNNHHYFPGSAAQGFRWWQVDPSYYLLWMLEKIGIVRDLHRAPERLRHRDAARRERPAPAGEPWNDAIRRLTERWVERRDAAWATARHAVEDLEAARVHAVEKLERLHAEAVELKARAGAAAEKRLEELHAEIEKCRAHLAEVLERLVAAAEAAVPAPVRV